MKGENMRNFGYVILIALAALAMFTLPAIVFAVEVPGVSPVEFHVPAMQTQTGTSWELLIYLAGTSVLAWLGRFIDQWIRDWLERRKSHIFTQGYQFVAHGVNAVFEGTVRGLKAAQNSGEWNEAKKLQVKNEAIAIAKQYARQHGFDLIKKVGAGTVDLLVEQVIGDRKAGKFVIGPLADLPPSRISVA